MMKNNAGMMQQIMQMQKQLKKTQKELEKATVTGMSGEGVVQITLTGSQKFQKVKIDGEKLKELSAETLEKMIGQALSDALEKSRSLMKDKLGPLGGGLGMKF